VVSTPRPASSRVASGSLALRGRLAYPREGGPADPATVRLVEFPLAGRSRAVASGRLTWLVAGLVLGALAALGVPNVVAALSERFS